MEISYWISRWEQDKTGWHMDHVFPPLQEFWPRLQQPRGSTVMVPLCGKSLDLDWLYRQGHRLIGVDVSASALCAVRQRMAALTFRESRRGSLTCYEAPRLQLWCGDFMKLKPRWVPPVDAVYDKAALIALPADRRRTYSAHLLSMLQPHTQLLMNTFEYEQDEMTGPPFAVSRAELDQLYGHQLRLELLQTRNLLPDLPGFRRRGLRSRLEEKIWHGTPRQDS